MPQLVPMPPPILPPPLLSPRSMHRLLDRPTDIAPYPLLATTAALWGTARAALTLTFSFLSRCESATLLTVDRRSVGATYTMGSGGGEAARFLPALALAAPPSSPSPSPSSSSPPASSSSSSSSSSEGAFALGLGFGGALGLGFHPGGLMAFFLRGAWRWLRGTYTVSSTVMAGLSDQRSNGVGTAALLTSSPGPTPPNPPPPQYPLNPNQERGNHTRSPGCVPREQDKAPGTGRHYKCLPPMCPCSCVNQRPAQCAGPPTATHTGSVPCPQFPPAAYLGSSLSSTTSSSSSSPS